MIENLAILLTEVRVRDINLTFQTQSRDKNLVIWREVIALDPKKGFVGNIFTIITLWHRLY